MPLALGLFFCLTARTLEEIMPQRSKMLYALQVIDTHLAQKKQRYYQIEAQLGESEAFRQARGALDAARNELSTLRGQLHDHELETASVGQKIQETEQRLYSGEIKNPKELGDLQREAEYLKRRKSTLEEQQIEDMVAVERLTKKVATTDKEFVTVESTWQEANTDLQTEYETLRQELGRLLGQRKGLLKHISPDDYARYQAMCRLRGGIAVVAVKHGSCRVCHVEVPERDWKRARDTDELYHCSGCERILYVPEE